MCVCVCGVCVWVGGWVGGVFVCWCFLFLFLYVCVCCCFGFLLLLLCLLGGGGVGGGGGRHNADTFIYNQSQSMIDNVINSSI